MRVEMGALAELFLGPIGNKLFYIVMIVSSLQQTIDKQYLIFIILINFYKKKRFIYLEILQYMLLQSLLHLQLQQEDFLLVIYIKK